MDVNKRLAHEAAPINGQDDCDDPDCACHEDTERPGDGAAEVTMTEVYDDQPGWCHPSGW